MTDKAKPVRLWQEIVLALALKSLVLAAIWAAWFSAPEDAGLDDRQVANRMLSPPPQKEHGHDAVPGTR